MTRKTKKKKKKDKKFEEEVVGLRNWLHNQVHFGRSRVLNPNKKKYRRKPKHKKKSDSSS